MASAVIGALRVNLGIDSAAFSKGLKQAQGGLARFGKLAKAGLLAAAAAAGAAAGGMAVLVKNTIDAADEMSKAASKIGIPIDELSRLKYAADLSGVSFEGLQTSVGRLSRVMVDAKNGNKGAIESFAELGISATKADGSLKSSTEVLKEISDRFATMPDGAQKTATAMKLMGRSGANMIPLLNGGSEALGNLLAEADQFGQVFSKEMGANAELFNDNISRLKGVFASLAAQIATALLPHLVKFSQWLVDNSDKIAAFAVGMVNAVAGIVEFGAEIIQLGTDLAAFVAGAWASFEAAWDGMVTKVHEVKQAIIDFAASIPGIFADLAAQMVVVGGQIIQGLWDGMKAKMAEVKQYLTDSINDMMNSVRSVLGIQSPSKVMHEIGVNVMQGLNDGMESMEGGISDIADSIGTTIGQAFQGVIDGSKSVKEAIADVLKSLASMALNSLFSGMGGGGFFGSLLKGIFGGGLPGFASGGSFQVGGAGGIDSQLVAFRASPNERVNVTKPGQGRDERLHITVGLASDGALNIMPEVRGVARGEAADAAGNVAKSVPRMVDSRNRAQQIRGVRA
jgi:hypothetical protein